MGVKNRQRRADKKRRRQRGPDRAHQAGRQRDWRVGWDSYPSASVEMLVFAAGHQAEHGDPSSVDDTVMMLSEIARVNGTRHVTAEVAAALSCWVYGAWDGGWQPAELARAVRRSSGPKHEKLVVTAMAGADVRRDWMPEEWADQLEALGATRWWGADQDWLSAHMRRTGTDWADAVKLTIETVGVVQHIPPIECLLPPPSSWTRFTASSRQGRVPDAILAKVQALLAKAESTQYEAEADALTAKAQELMARHSIDESIARQSAERREVAIARRILIDDPYADAKSYLLGCVADPNGVKTVWQGDFAMMTLVGFSADLDAVDALFTSLLLQATKAMLDKGARTDSRGRSRTRRFRKSFLLSYADRIYERLRAATVDARTHAEEELHTDLLPVLASRDDQVREALFSIFPRLVSNMGPAATDYEGWVAGRAAAELAKLGPEQGVLISFD